MRPHSITRTRASRTSQHTVPKAAVSSRRKFRHHRHPRLSFHHHRLLLLPSPGPPYITTLTRSICSWQIRTHTGMAVVAVAVERCMDTCTAQAFHQHTCPCPVRLQRRQRRQQRRRRQQLATRDTCLPAGHTSTWAEGLNCPSTCPCPPLLRQSCPPLPDLRTYLSYQCSSGLLPSLGWV